MKYYTWFACLLFSGGLPAQEPQPIFVINNTNYPPYSTPSHNGYIDLIAEEAFRRIGVRLRLTVLPAERGLLNVNSGIIDGDLTRIEGLELKYPHLVRVPENIMFWQFEAFSKESTHTATRRYIRGHSVAYIKGWKIYEEYLRGAKYTTTVNHPEQLFRLLELGRVDIVLYEHWMGIALMQKMHINDITPVQPPVARRKMYIYLNKRDEAFVPALSTALRNMKRDGFYKRAFDKTLRPYLNALHEE